MIKIGDKKEIIDIEDIDEAINTLAGIENGAISTKFIKLIVEEDA